ncbi:MAG: RDD family protein [Bacteroidota bacterium]
MENFDTPLDDLRFETMDQIEYANFGERLAARIIDSFVIFIPSLFFPILPSWLYFAFMESGDSQATVGKKALGLIVTDLEGQRIDFSRASGRYFGNIICVLTIFIGYLTMLFNHKGQCLHDVMAGTVVIRRRSQPANNPTTLQSKPRSATTRNWEQHNALDDYSIVKVDETGVQLLKRTPVGQTRENYTLQELAQGTVDFSDSLGAEKSDDIKAYARDLLNLLRQRRQI